VAVEGFGLLPVDRMRSLGKDDTLGAGNTGKLVAHDPRWALDVLITGGRPQSLSFLHFKSVDDALHAGDGPGELDCLLAGIEGCDGSGQVNCAGTGYYFDGAQI
jgi:hypothetical protein